MRHPSQLQARDGLRMPHTGSGAQPAEHWQAVLAQGTMERVRDAARAVPRAGTTEPEAGRVTFVAPSAPGKRLFDAVVAAALLVALAPLFLLLGVAIRIQGGPAFYAHRRLGMRLREFRCLKFRTMRTDGDAVLERLLSSDPEARREWAETRKLRNDPRVTRLGRFLRRTSLDELPQLFNVLRGEMSLVGPRPVVQEELDLHYGPAAAAYALVRPGITGLWQVSGRSDTSYRTRVALDVEYVATLSVRRDIGILLRTVFVVLARRGAV